MIFMQRFRIFNRKTLFAVENHFVLRWQQYKQYVLNCTYLAEWKAIIGLYARMCRYTLSYSSLKNCSCVLYCTMKTYKNTLIKFLSADEDM